MPTITTDFAVAFTVAQDRRTGTLRLADNTDYAGQGITPSNVRVDWGFTGPDGREYLQLVANGAASIHPGTSLTSTVSLPNTVSGIMAGDYTLTITTYSAVGPIDQTETLVANLCLDYPETCLQPYTDCKWAVTRVVDETGWAAAGWTVNSRSLTIYYPPNISVSPSSITSTGSTVSSSGYPLHTGWWSLKGVFSVTKGNLTLSITVTDQYEVMCSAAACKRWCTVRAMQVNWANAVSGQWPDVLAREAAFKTAAALATLIEQLESCGFDTSSAEAEFVKVTQTCGCSGECNTGTLIPPSGVLATGLEAGYGIDITAGVVSLTQDVQDLLASIAVVTLTSVDGSVALSHVGDNYDLSVDLRDHAVFTIKFKLGTGGPAVTYSAATGTEFDLSGLTITPTGGFGYYIDGFHSGSSPYGDWNLQYAQNTRIERAPYNNSHRSSPLVDFKVINRNMANGGFTVTFEITQPGLSHAQGVGYDMSVIDTYLSEINVDFLVYKY